LLFNKLVIIEIKTFINFLIIFVFIYKRFCELFYFDFFKSWESIIQIFKLKYLYLKIKITIKLVKIVKIIKL